MCIRDRRSAEPFKPCPVFFGASRFNVKKGAKAPCGAIYSCLLYTSDAADDLLCVDLGGRRIIKKNTQNIQQ